MYEFNISYPKLNNFGYIKAIANVKDKHDRSTPSNYHWKILKCRMIIFSASTILASPDKTDERHVHIVFNQIGGDYDCLLSLFMRFSLQQVGGINEVTPETYLMCFQYTMTAKIAPVWNVLGYNYLINNRDFLTTTGPQNGMQIFLNIDDERIKFKLKPVKIHLIKSDEQFTSEEYVRVFPSLNKAIVRERLENLPNVGDFVSYKELRRHWKNIHGYRLPEKEYPYYRIQFWRGEPLTYPEICLTRNFPIITPVPKPIGVTLVSSFLECLKNKMPHVIEKSITSQFKLVEHVQQDNAESLQDTQAVSLCTPSQD